MRAPLGACDDHRLRAQAGDNFAMAVNLDLQRSESADTSSRILDVAERLVQLRGFNGFSYADVASESGAPPEAAQAIVSGLEGAMLIGRPYDDVRRFDSAASRLLASLVRDAPAPVPNR